MTHDLMTVDQAAIHLHIGSRTIYRLLASGQLKASKIGRRTFISRAGLDDFIRNLPGTQPVAA